LSHETLLGDRCIEEAHNGLSGSARFSLREVAIVAEQLGVPPQELSQETSFFTDLGADSLDFVELIMELEEEFDLPGPPLT